MTLLAFLWLFIGTSAGNVASLGYDYAPPVPIAAATSTYNTNSAQFSKLELPVAPNPANQASYSAPFSAGNSHESHSAATNAANSYLAPATGSQHIYSAPALSSQQTYLAPKLNILPKFTPATSHNATETIRHTTVDYATAKTSLSAPVSSKNISSTPKAAQQSNSYMQPAQHAAASIFQNSYSAPFNTTKNAIKSTSSYDVSHSMLKNNNKPTSSYSAPLSATITTSAPDTKRYSATFKATENQNNTFLTASSHFGSINSIRTYSAPSASGQHSYSAPDKGTHLTAKSLGENLFPNIYKAATTVHTTFDYAHVQKSNSATPKTSYLPAAQHAAATTVYSSYSAPPTIAKTTKAPTSTHQSINSASLHSTQSDLAAFEGSNNIYKNNLHHSNEAQSYSAPFSSKAVHTTSEKAGNHAHGSLLTTNNAFQGHTTSFSADRNAYSAPKTTVTPIKGYAPNTHSSLHHAPAYKSYSAPAKTKAYHSNSHDVSNFAYGTPKQATTVNPYSAKPNSSHSALGNAHASILAPVRATQSIYSAPSISASTFRNSAPEFDNHYHKFSSTNQHAYSADNTGASPIKYPSGVDTQYAANGGYLYR